MKTLTVTVGDEGEITLPPEMLERLGVSAGEEIEFVMDDGCIHLRSKQDQEEGSGDEPPR